MARTTIQNPGSYLVTDQETVLWDSRWDSITHYPFTAARHRAAQHPHNHDEEAFQPSTTLDHHPQASSRRSAGMVQTLPPVGGTGPTVLQNQALT